MSGSNPEPLLRFPATSDLIGEGDGGKEIERTLPHILPWLTVGREGIRKWEKTISKIIGESEHTISID